MRRTVREALDRLDTERGDSRPARSEAVVALPAEGGGCVLAPRGDCERTADGVLVGGEEWLVIDLSVDREVIR